MNEKKFIQGNKARLKPDKSLSPRFTNYVASDYMVTEGTAYPLNSEDDTDFIRKEANNNK
ncbi:MAG: hypothetical protein FWG70_03135 [Oscillospiraceae bacterium]|nr:hypothetical protein [Oscillospiraceae bacterium]